MRFHYAGPYTGLVSDLPQRDPMPENANEFREPEDMRKFAVISSIVSMALVVALWLLMYFYAGRYVYNLIGIILSFVAIVPHELIHALMFRDDVYMYSNIRQGMLFVVGTEDFSRLRFVLMSLAPSIIFGIVPMIIWFANPEPGYDWLAMFGLASTVMSAGDFINVFNAITQVPQGAKVFLSGMHTYWYQPE